MSDLTFRSKLAIETKETANRLNALNDFMKTKEFYELDRQHKDLLYAQQRLMSEYVQVLGIRCELLSIQLDVPFDE